jgi:hypothetical protein
VDDAKKKEWTVGLNKECCADCKRHENWFPERVVCADIALDKQSNFER